MTHIGDPAPSDCLMRRLTSGTMPDLSGMKLSRPKPPSTWIWPVFADGRSRYISQPIVTDRYAIDY
jgi:hypothetical protein